MRKKVANFKWQVAEPASNNLMYVNLNTFCEKRWKNSPPYKGGDRLSTRSARKSGVIVGADLVQPPLHRSLDASRCCPLLTKAGNYRHTRRKLANLQSSIFNLQWLLFLACCLLPTAYLIAQSPTGEELLKKIDENLIAENRISTSKMIIHSKRGTRTVVAKNWIQGAEKSFTEYLSPPREKGTKMLKLDDQLWTYSPGTDRTIKISGHMLRQSVMGSDLSYEDFMEDRKLQDVYTAEVIGEEIITERDCWVVELIAKQPDIAYHSRKLWVDKNHHIPLREERFAKSGKLLKSTSIKEVMAVDKRWIAKHIIFKDELKSGDGTEFVLEAIEFNADIPNHIFSKAVLRK